MIKGLFRIITEVLYPRRCPICGEIVVPRGIKVHQECKELLQYIGEPKCKKCGKPVENDEKEFCYDCGRKQFHYVKGYSLWVYDKRLQSSIAAYKYKNKKEYASFYVEEFLRAYADEIGKLAPDFLIPIPIHNRKRRIRGFNQAEIIARGIGSEIGVPILNNLLIRVRDTKPQKGLNDKDRMKNLESAFMVSRRYQKEYLHINKVILVDDIYTTGSTIEACTKVLLEFGVEEVYYISLCIGKGF